MELFLSIMLVYGITNIVVNGSIFYKAKELLMSNGASQNNKIKKNLYLKLYKLLNCAMCFGFWAGLILGIHFGPFAGLYALLNGFFFSGTTWIINCFVQFLGNGFDPSRTINVIIDGDSVLTVKEPEIIEKKKEKELLHG